jgi:nucleoid-associated protein YgaU
MRSGPISRWATAIAAVDDAGRVVLTERTPFAFVERADNREHTVLPGDTLAALADTYFDPWPRACGYWWAIAEFQREPIVDPTRPLEVGRVLAIPSVAALEDFLGGPP